MTLPFRPGTVSLTRRHPALFAWSVRDGALMPATGQAVTFTRATAGTAWDATGRLVTPVQHQRRLEGVLNSVTGRTESVLLVEPARTNLCLQSENFGTTWTAIGTPTRTAAARTLGDLTLDLIGDDDAAALEGYRQTVTFTGNAVKVVQIVLAAGTSTSTVIRLRDTTASADRLLATVSWSGGVPSVVMTTGTQIGSPIARASGAYSFEFQTTTLTAANTNELQVYPATTSGLATSNTGTVYAGGVAAFDAATGGSYIKTTTATVTRNGEAWSVAANWPMPDNETWYIRLARPRWADLSGTLGAAYLVSRGTSGNSMGVSFLAASRTIQAELGSGSVTQTAAMPAGSGGFIEVAVQFADLLTAPRCRIDTGAGYGSYSATGSALTALPTSIVLGDAAWAAGSQLGGGLSSVVVVAGLRTLAELQGL